ncbi:MAG: AAA family ATPase [Desulfuromonadales bacterium]|nr:AAA family ATPase [Desulfuromonadales bacterium]
MRSRPYLKEISLKENMTPDWDEYPFNIPAIQNLKTLEFHPDVTFLVGENGAGKSTLVEAIALAMGFSPEGGTRNFNLATADTISPLHKYLKTVKSYATPKDYYFLRAESFYNVATYMAQTGGAVSAGYGEKELHERSHGEAFMAALSIKLKGRGFYIFDEPEAALSPIRQMAALSAIHQLVNDKSQFIIATHSPILLAYPRAKILCLDESGISEVAYEDTDHYSITKSFLNNYKKLLRTLLDDD